ncbi:OmpL47-type beta-barrel domain-containing protein [Paenibacillus sp.]|uniref:OmpL47-type beta-barrel domain-containing protein n=1 Tax=Paenibacillus sp. TaxID=58172 RepID=UPI0035682916
MRASTASVYAEAGTSGIDTLTYTLDGGPAQAYENQTSILFDQEGAHTITFLVTDTAGNTLTVPLSVNIDQTSPSVSFGGNGSETWANSASTSVTVSDSGGIFAPSEDATRVQAAVMLKRFLQYERFID